MMVNIYRQNGTKCVFQANATPQFANLSLDDPETMSFHMNAPTAFQVWQEPMKAEEGDLQIVSARYFGQ